MTIHTSFYFSLHKDYIDKETKLSMKKFINASILILVLVMGINKDCYSHSYQIVLHRIPGNYSTNCISAVVNYNESIIRIQIDGTIQGEGLLEIRNLNQEVTFTQTIKSWNEGTILDIELDQFIKGTYYISFSSNSLKCNGEFSIN